MRRKIYDRLLQWKQEKDGTTALMIEGARRVGKSYIAESILRYKAMDLPCNLQIIHQLSSLYLHKKETKEADSHEPASLHHSPLSSSLPFFLS